MITADDQLDKLADDFVEHCSARWQSGKALFVCIDKITCARVYQRIMPRWQARLQELREQIPVAEAQIQAATNEDIRDKRAAELTKLRGRIAWMESTIIEIVISEAQNEVRDFAKWGFDIVPHRERMKKGFTDAAGRTRSLEDAFKSPEHPFRVAIVCAMWLTGFDVECLSTLYLDKPMKAHTLMQAIARANRVYPGKDCGVIVDYNGMLKSLRQALAQYAVGDDEAPSADDVVAPIEDLVASLADALKVAEGHLRSLDFDPARLNGATGFDKIAALKDATNALYTTDESKRRFEIMAREVFSRFKALVTEPAAFVYLLDHLLREEFSFQTELADGVESVALTQILLVPLVEAKGLDGLHLRFPKSQPWSESRSIIDDLLAGRDFSRNQVGVDLVLIRLQFMGDGNRRGKSLTVRVSPRSCNLKQENDEEAQIVAERCLRRWGVING